MYIVLVSHHAQFSTQLQFLNWCDQNLMQSILDGKRHYCVNSTLPCQKKLPGAPMNSLCPSCKEQRPI